MISSASSPDRVPRTEALSANSSGASRPQVPRDRLSVESLALLRAELQRQPEVRPEVVARGRALAADPGYPSWEIVHELAGRILAAPDLSSEDA